jgi:hypothetical protein
MVGKKGYVPDKLITNYMQDKLLFEKKRDETDLRGKALKDNEAYLNLKKRKTDVLNKIFTSMANLIFFFESVAEIDDLRSIFENDILDLLGLKRNYPEIHRPGYIFSRLINSILLTGKIPGREDAVDFRLLLIDLLQQALTEKISKSLPSVIDREPGAKKNVLDDFDTARAWTRMARNMVDRNTLSGTPHRIFDIDTSRIFSEEAA